MREFWDMAMGRIPGIPGIFRMNVDDIEVSPRARKIFNLIFPKS